MSFSQSRGWEAQAGVFGVWGELVFWVTDSPLSPSCGGLLPASVDLHAFPNPHLLIAPLGHQVSTQDF